MAELIKPCPFCGGEAKFTYSVNGSHMHIHCEDTNCIGSTIMNDYETEAEAIEAWNNRATESEIRASVIDEVMEKLAEEICVGCGCLKDRKCTYKGSNCRVSKIMLEKSMKVLEQLKGGMRNGKV